MQGEAEQRKVQSPAPGKEQPKAPVHAVHHPEGTLLDRKGPEFTVSHQVENETAMYPCFKAAKWYPGLHQTEQVKGDGLSCPLGTTEAAPGVLCTVLGFPGQKMIKGMEHCLLWGKPEIAETVQPRGGSFSRTF